MSKAQKHRSGLKATSFSSSVISLRPGRDWRQGVAVWYSFFAGWRPQAHRSLHRYEGALPPLIVHATKFALDRWVTRAEIPPRTLLPILRMGLRGGARPPQTDRTQSARCKFFCVDASSARPREQKSEKWISEPRGRVRGQETQPASRSRWG